MALFGLHRKEKQTPQEGECTESLKSLLHCYSIEVIPKTAEKIARFSDILPKNTRVYIAHIEGTSIDAMVKTARRLAVEGYEVMPHFPARLIKNRMELADWIARYQGEAGVSQALLLGGGRTQTLGDFSDSMALVETELFKDFKRLHFAGHPEGNKDIDPDGSDKNLLHALKWKQDFSERSDAEVAITTQFCFDAQPVIEWANQLKAEGIHLPIHLGLAGPAKLQTLMKYALTCGIGPSIHVLQRRAKDVTKLLVPYEPTDIAQTLAHYKRHNPESSIAQVHLFPLGGIQASADWANHQGGRVL